MMKSNSQDAYDPNAETRLIQWIIANIGGTIKNIERQPRWRPSWYAEVEKDGKILPLYLRGARYDLNVPLPIDQEGKVLQILEANGIPVPHIYGLCEDPPTLIMERSPGKGNLANAESEAERVSVLEHLGEIMAKIRTIDPAEFSAVGLKVPQSSEDIALNIFKQCEKQYLAEKKVPDPRIEFIIRWLKRNVPGNPFPPTLQQADAGQFLFENGKVTALHDFEYAVICDPHQDLAALRARAIQMPLGDLRPLFKTYLNSSHTQLRRFDFLYQNIAWHVTGCMQTCGILAEPDPVGNFPEYMSWYLCSLTAALQPMAEVLGIPVERPKLASPQPSRWVKATEILEKRIPRPDMRMTSEGIADEGATSKDYEQMLNHDLATVARRNDLYRAELEAEYIADTENILGRRVNGWADADAQLESFILTAGPEYDARLLSMFIRWTQRQLQLIEGTATDNPLIYNLLQPVDELLP